MQQKFIPSIVLIVAGVVFYYWWSFMREPAVPIVSTTPTPTPTEEIESLGKQLQVNPGSDVPDVNPYQADTNPFEEKKTNPFKDSYTNPFD